LALSGFFFGKSWTIVRVVGFMVGSSSTSMICVVCFWDKA
jgi:hypothetical protein